MDAIQSEHVEAFLQLLPGFVTAWIFYGFTAHPKPSLFERVVQALIFTTIIQAILSLVRQIGPSGQLVTDFALVTSLGLAVILGFLTVVIVNGDWLHSAMRMAGFSKRTAMPSEWYVAFYRSDNYVILHLEDGRRLYGYPLQWPDNSLEGHFELMDSEWLLKDNRRVPIPTTERFLLPGKLVEFVEFLRYEHDLAEFKLVDQASESETILIEEQKGD